MQGKRLVYVEGECCDNDNCLACNGEQRLTHDNCHETPKCTIRYEYR